MEFIYLLLGNQCDWEDIMVFTELNEAIEISIKYPNLRVEIFSKNINKSGYTPTYNYYKNGLYIKNN
jgi:hypothetical protein